MYEHRKRLVATQPANGSEKKTKLFDLRFYANTQSKEKKKNPKREYNVTLILYNYFFFFGVFETT